MTIKRLARLSLLIIFNILAIEVICRIVIASYMGSPDLLLFGTNGYVSHSTDVMTPDFEQSAFTTYTPNSVKYHMDWTNSVHPIQINNYGFRGDDFVSKKSPETVRVLTLGASSTFGYLARDWETYPFQLEQLLNQRCNSSKKYQVYNLGIPHLRSTDTVGLLEEIGMKLSPDIVTLYEGSNDAGYPVENFITATKWGAAKYSLFLHIIHKALWLLLTENQSLTNAELDTLATQRTQTFLSNLRSINNTAHQHGARFIFANQQVRTDLFSSEELHGVTYEDEVERVRGELKQGRIDLKHALMIIHQQMMLSAKEWSLKNDVPFVDIISAMNRSREMLLSKVHLSPEGNKLIAEKLADQILTLTCTDSIH